MQLEEISNKSNVAKVESALLMGAILYCEQNGYQHIIIPHLTKATGACENFSTLFKTDLFGETAYLNQTGQLLLEAFMDRFEKTYCHGPSFRKEIKADERHLIEFPLFEIEVADCNLQRLQQEINGIFGMILRYCKSKCSEELKELGVTAQDIKRLMPPYNSITYREALDSLSGYGLEFGDDLKAEHEQYLVQRNGNKPLFVTHYPQQIKFFNMRLNREDPTVVNSMDLLMPSSGEAVGAAEREEDYKILMKRLLESDMLRLLKQAIQQENGFGRHTHHKLEEEALSRFKWYLDIIKQKPITHAGCGIGLNRVTQSLLNSKDIRECTVYPMNRETLF